MIQVLALAEDDMGSEPKPRKRRRKSQTMVSFLEFVLREMKSAQELQAKQHEEYMTMMKEQVLFLPPGCLHL